MYELTKEKLRKHPARRLSLANALANLQPDSGASDDYCRGLVVGVVSTLMTQNASFDTAIKILAANLTPPFRTSALPDAWRENIETAYLKLFH